MIDLLIDIAEDMVIGCIIYAVLMGLISFAKQQWSKIDEDEYYDPSLSELQAQQNEWSDRQGWERGDGTLAFIGMIEELGEMADAIGIPQGSDHSVVKTILIMQQLGQYAHATLKRIQGIRGTEEQHREAATEAMYSLADLITNHRRSQDVIESGQPTNHDALADGAGDLVIYAFDVFNNKGLDLESTIFKTCEQVFARDWVKYPKDGRAA